MITRFAPSLTGYLHLGHVLHMLYVWGIAKAKGADIVSRIEDHDLGRARPEYESAILETMEWLGFIPTLGISSADEGFSSDYRQSDCADHYAEVLTTLEKNGRVYGCGCSRKQIRESSAGGMPSSASAVSGDAVPPVMGDELCYSGTCSGKGLPLEGNTVRFRVPESEVVFNDLKLGECRQTPSEQCGDFSLRDRNAQWTYQFCCVCDDIRHSVDLVIRGEDILSSTARQIQLFHALEKPVPTYFHHPLLRDESGNKLSKRQHSESISQLREAGVLPEEIIGKTLFQAGLAPTGEFISRHNAIENYII
ncbi:MAG: glutamate--tRNA ligase family protein [Pontiella sp.]